jgi:4'-phosphopantetheinyl transferase
MMAAECAMSPTLRICRIHELLGPVLGPLAIDWVAALTTQERAALCELRAPERRQQWLAGRVLMKQLLASQSGLEVTPAALAQIEIVSQNAEGKGIAPQASILGKPFQGSLSLTHQGDTIAAALIPGVEWAVGIDLVPDEPFGAGFADMWFTAAERAWALAETEAPSLTASIWALKEAAYKAINHGESFQPQAIEIGRNTAGEWRFAVRGMCAPLDWVVQIEPVPGPRLLAMVYGRKA